MTKKYAPDVPDAKWHRPGDVAYLRELIEASGLSVRAIADRLGFRGRGALRSRLSGETPISYAEQYTLEQLADANCGTDAPPASAVSEEPPAEYRIGGTVWRERRERPITAADAGKLIIGFDRRGGMLAGRLVADGFGVTVRAERPDALDGQPVDVGRIETYTLLDPPHGR